MQTGYAQPGRRVEAVDVEEVRRGEEREMEGQEEGVEVVGGEGCAEEGEGEGEEDGLATYLAWILFSDYTGYAWRTMTFAQMSCLWVLGVFFF